MSFPTLSQEESVERERVKVELTVPGSALPIIPLTLSVSIKPVKKRETQRFNPFETFSSVVETTLEELRRRLTIDYDMTNVNT